MVIFHSYVNLPEGNAEFSATRKDVVFVWYITSVERNWWKIIDEGELLETTTFWKSLWTVQSIESYRVPF